MLSKRAFYLKLMHYDGKTLQDFHNMYYTGQCPSCLPTSSSEETANDNKEPSVI